MRNIHTEILVIGGGATGTGIVRDLALRGFKTVLVERRDLTDGTSGRYHGLLHSGGRYAVKDPQAAHECIEENRILRKIMPQCIEDTGGFFVQTPEDDPDYAPKFVEGCQKAGIPCEDVPIHQMLREEPLLNPSIARCFRVPDGSADSFLAADLNAESARQHGAEILCYHPVTALLLAEQRITGAVCHDLVKDEDVVITADLVINAAGAWAGKIAALAGIIVQMTPGKGTMIALNHRVVNTVINRCKMPGDGDIIVPAHTVAVIGTTDVKVPDPDHFGIESWEIELMLIEGEKLLPNFRQLRLLRAWAGVRPLFQETVASKNRDITRAFILLDHEERDDVSGLITITSGKWTTYRKMAEVTVDKICEKLGSNRECRTHLEELPAVHHGGERSEGLRHQSLGHHLAEVEKNQTYGDLVCECELATRKDVERAILEGNAQTLDDIRRDVRLGMGPCQGGFCTIRAASLLHRLRHPPIEQTNLALRDFLQERWKGLVSVLWGQQLRQERLDELIYLNVLNTDHLPGPKEGRLSPDDYSPPENPILVADQSSSVIGYNEAPNPLLNTNGYSPDVIVIGAGLSGLFAAYQTAIQGKKVKVIAKGWGATHWSSGCIDVLGYYPVDRWRAIDSPANTLPQFLHEHPKHPYAISGITILEKALKTFQNLCADAGYPMHGSLETNWLIPTALGAIRPACLIPETMAAGDLRKRDPLLVVGFEHYIDFCPHLVTDNLNGQYIFASDAMLDLPSLRDCKFVTSLVLARLFDTPEFRAEVVEALIPKLSNATRVGFPAVLGLENSLEAKRDLEQQLGRPVFEIPGLPPSIPGIRLHNILVNAIAKVGGHIFNGMQVVQAIIHDNQQTAHGNPPISAPYGHIDAVLTEAAARFTHHRAREFILASGGLLGGGINTTSDGYAQETIFRLPIPAPPNRTDWFQRQFLSPQGHAIYRTGLAVNPDFRPVDRAEKPIFDNLYAVGGILGDCDPIRERSLEGLALVTGYLVGEKMNH